MDPKIKAQAEANRKALEEFSRYMSLLSAKPDGLTDSEKTDLDGLALKWTKITDHLFGNEIDQAIAFIDICGTSANLGDVYGSERPSDKFPTLSILREFQTALGMCAVINPDLEIYCFSDSGFVIGKNALHVFQAVHGIVGFLHGLSDKNSAIPVRGAMSYGKLTGADLSATLKVKNFVSGPLASEGLVKVSIMEKTKKLSGIRFFATEAFKLQIPENVRVLISNVEIDKVSVNGSKQEAYYQVHWLPFVVACNPNRQRLLGFYGKWADTWSKSDNTHKQQIAESIKEMLKIYESDSSKKST